MTSPLAPWYTMTTSTRGSVLHRRDVELDAPRVPLDDGPVEDDAVAVDDAEHAVAARLERLEPQRVGLGHLARGVDLVVEHDQHALAARLRLGRHAEPLEQVGRALRIRACSGCASSRPRPPACRCGR